MGFKIENKKMIVEESKREKEDKDEKLEIEDVMKGIVDALPKIGIVGKEDKDAEHEPRYILADIPSTSDDGRPQTKVTFIHWAPDDAKIGPKMLYASSKDAITKKLTGIMKQMQVTEEGDFSSEEIEKKMRTT